VAEDGMGLVDAVRKGEAPGCVDWLREVVQRLVQELMEAEVSAQIGAERYERTEERTAQRNGYRPRAWDTRLGTLALAIPKLRTAATSRVGWSHGGGPSRRWWRWSPRRTCTA